MKIHAKIAQSGSPLVPTDVQRTSVVNMVTRHLKPKSSESMKTAVSICDRSASDSTRNIKRGKKMPRHIVVYDKELKNTPEFQPLYSKWAGIRTRRFPISEEFEQFLFFYNWSMANGYEAGARLRLLDESKPYGPYNCIWEPAAMRPEWTAEEMERISKWNKTVNLFRIHFGLEPFPVGGDL